MGVVIALIFFEIWFDLLPPHPKLSLGSQRGSSVLSFVALYLLARFIRLYGVPHWFRRRSPIIYILCSITLSVLAFFSFKVGHPAMRIIYAYSNPLVILSAVSFLLTFEKMSIGENHVVNHIAKSTLSVLLAHTSIIFLYTRQFHFIYNHFSGGQELFFWTLAIVIVFVVSVAIDQLRLLLWSPMEKSLRRQIKQNELF